jgi:hypothetical protein
MAATLVFAIGSRTPLACKQPEPGTGGMNVSDTQSVFYRSRLSPVTQGRGVAERMEVAERVGLKTNSVRTTSGSG